MLIKGSIPRVHVGEIAVTLAAAPILFRGVSTSPVLLRGYLDSLERCAAANDCRYCQRELEQAHRALAGRSCPHCGREPFRQFCQRMGPCVGKDLEQL